GSQGSLWTQTIVSIGQDRNFEVVFEVENGGVSGYVAIDDIVFSGCGDQTSGSMCDVGSFQCSDGQCIFADEVCDMREDCDDGSDETSCTLHAGDCTFEGQVWAGQTGCQYVQNLDDNADWVVTGSGSGPSSDHTPSAGHIATPAPVQCSSHEFSCTNNGVVECMPTTWKCDGFIDCSDGSDELGCPPVTNKPGTTPQQNTGKCKDNQFRCSDDVCISGLLVCDGVADCTSGEDELGCPVITCAVGQFFCGDDGGACLSSSLQCDAQVDC
uniref:MAM domain-containing protein n=1 Tax=Ciona savignyi TaxID=51511 RepID=H2YIS5_CIOSA